MTNKEIRLRVRLNALVRAYVRGEETVKGRPMTQEEIIAELRTIKAVLEAAKEQESTETK